MQIANTAGQLSLLSIPYPQKKPTKNADMVIHQPGHTKKVVTNAVLFLGYCAGNIAGPFFYKSDQSYVDHPMLSDNPRTKKKERKVTNKT
jgi:hypothetical protein